MNNIPVGSLIRTKRTPISNFTAVGWSQYFFDEKTENCCAIPDGTYGLVVNTNRISAVGNKIIDVLFDERILSIADYTDQYGRLVWCDIVCQ